ncbi:MAG TPA: restriction endonuclease subunit S, partial [Solirubrobacteraceae bacterium]
DFGVVPREGRDDNYNKPGEDPGAYRVVQRGDLVLNKMKTWQGSLGISDHEGIVSPAYFVARPLTDDSPTFLHHLLRSLPLIAEYGARSKGIRPSQWDLPWDEFRNIAVTLPSPATQRAIADYLDRETDRLDSLIEAKKAMVTLLEERRAATIASFVTPPSDDPEWRRLRLRYVLARMVDTEHKTAPFYDDGEFLVVRTNNVSRGRLVIGSGSKFTDAAGYREWTRRGVPEPGDILFTREASAGEACLVPEDLQGCVGQRTVLFKVNRGRILAQYCLWALYGGIARSFIDELSQGSTVPHLNMSDIADIPLWVPDIETQQRIANHLDEATSRIDGMVDAITKQIALLGEHRQAIVTAAVTGQLDIPEAA